MDVTFDPRTSAMLAQQLKALAGSAVVLASFGEADPDLARECGVEIGALEARTILSGGAPDRIVRAAEEAARTGRNVAIPAGDLEAVSRLEQVVALGSSRIGLKMAAIDAEASQDGLAKITNLIGLAGGAYGFLKSVNIL